MKSASITRRGACAAIALASLVPAVFAQTWPTKPVTLVVPGPAGGTPDVVARQLAQQLKPELGQAIVVDNRAGAAGNIGVTAVARAEADGYTLLMGFAQTMAINPVAFKKLPYDPVADFVPIARLVTFELGLVVPESVPARTVPELVAWIKANPGNTAYGSFGNGTPSQFAGAMFNRRAGIEGSVHVPYKGSAPLVTELLGGQVQYGFVVPQVALPHVKAGKLRLLAVTGEKRSAALPQVPTMKELGFDEVVAGGWYGLFAPKGTPPAIVERLAKATDKAMKSPELSKMLAEQDLRAAFLPGREFATFLQAEIARWRATAARTNFAADQ